ncbi:MAG: DUF4956 domain-containing protein [Melioribacteraceae bacterium]|nr:DUF4956 domain-containing protein [Melioribacteraceae bacterium]
MLDDLNTIFEISITFDQIVENLIVAFICGLLISFFYRKTYQGPGYLNSFVNSLIILSMITAIVIMIIGNNLARAFGLVGAMSIIRFRTAVKETQDIIYIFFSLAVGMAAGVGLHGLALFSTVVIGVVSFVLNRSPFLTPSKRDYLLQFAQAGDSGENDNRHLEILNKYCRRINLINVKSVGESESMEYSYYIGFKHKVSSGEFISELKKLKGIRQVNLFFDEEYF